jgi:hypothetical protein
MHVLTYETVLTILFLSSAINIMLTLHIADRGAYITE